MMTRGSEEKIAIDQRKDKKPLGPEEEDRDAHERRTRRSKDKVGGLWAILLG